MEGLLVRLSKRKKIKYITGAKKMDAAEGILENVKEKKEKIPPSRYTAVLFLLFNPYI
jgi:hypothetical protein